MYSFNDTLSIRPTCSFPHYVHKSILYVSISTLQISTSTILLGFIYMH